MPKPYRSRAEYYYGALTEGYEGELPRPQSREDAYLLKLIDQMSSQTGKATFTPRGSVQNVSNLPSLDSAQAGDIYNIQTDSKTTADFVEGAGVTIKGGTNVYCVLNSDNAKKWDAFGSTYAVDYALDPSSGHPLANNAVCAAIDNVTDQLNPAFVERIKTVNVPTMSYGKCCKILEISDISYSPATIILELPLDPTGTNIGYSEIIVDLHAGLLAGINPLFLLDIDSQEKDNYVVGFIKDGSSASVYLLCVSVNVPEFSNRSLDVRCYLNQTGTGIKATILSDPVLEDISDLTFNARSTDVGYPIAYTIESGAASGEIAVYPKPHGRGFCILAIEAVNCRAGDVIARNREGLDFMSRYMTNANMAHTLISNVTDGATCTVSITPSEIRIFNDMTNGTILPARIPIGCAR